MILIKQQDNRLFEIFVSKVETVRAQQKQVSQVSRILRRAGKVSIKGNVVYLSPNDAELSLDDVLWTLCVPLRDHEVDQYVVRAISSFGDAEIWTSCEGSIIYFNSDAYHHISAWDFGECNFCKHYESHSRFDFYCDHAKAIKIVQEIHNLVQ